MLFNLTRLRFFRSKTYGGKIIWQRRDIGPSFTSNKTIYGPELGAIREPFNGENNCVSYPNQNGYCISEDKSGKNMLTNKKKSTFTITELEVWEVKEIEE